MAEMFDIYDATGAQIGAIPISAQQREQLHAGVGISIAYHTPRMLREALGIQNGNFEVREDDRGRLITDHIEQVKRYIILQSDIARAMKQPDKWTDPDAQSDSSIR